MKTTGYAVSCDLKNKDFLSDVIKSCRYGDMKAMETIYNYYKSSLFNLAYRFCGNHISAEDLLQEIFIKVFTQINKLRSLEAFNTWLYRIAVNTCISFIRKKETAKEVPLDEIEETNCLKNDVLQLRQDLGQVINILPPKQKIIFILHDVQGFTHIEIAKFMKLSEGTCKSQLFKARMKLRNHLVSV